MFLPRPDASPATQPWNAAAEAGASPQPRSTAPTPASVVLEGLRQALARPEVAHGGPSRKTLPHTEAMHQMQRSRSEAYVGPHRGAPEGTSAGPPRSPQGEVFGEAPRNSPSATPLPTQAFPQLSRADAHPTAPIVPPVSPSPAESMRSVEATFGTGHGSEAEQPAGAWNLFEPAGAWNLLVGTKPGSRERQAPAQALAVPSDVTWQAELQRVRTELYEHVAVESEVKVHRLRKESMAQFQAELQQLRQELSAKSKSQVDGDQLQWLREEFAAVQAESRQQQVELQRLRQDLALQFQAISQAEMQRVRAEMAEFMTAQKEVELARLRQDLASQLQAHSQAEVVRVREELADHLTVQCEAQVQQVTALRQELAGMRTSQSRVFIEQELERLVQAECAGRCAGDDELQATFTREIGEINTRLQEQRHTSQEEIADVGRRITEQGASVDKAIERERSERRRESAELRAILDSVWKRASSPSHSQGKAHGAQLDPMDSTDDQYKEQAGDPEDINTLYEMVREALGDTVHLKLQMEQLSELYANDHDIQRSRFDHIEQMIELSAQQALAPAEAGAAAQPQAPGVSEAPPEPWWNLRRLSADAGVNLRRLSLDAGQA